MCKEYCEHYQCSACINRECFRAKEDPFCFPDAERCRECFLLVGDCDDCGFFDKDFGCLMNCENAQ